MALNILANTLFVNSLVTDVLDAFGDPTLICVAGSYIMIHLKEAGEDGMNGGTSNDAKISSINFVDDRLPPGI